MAEPSGESFLPLASIVFSEQTYESTLQHVIDTARDCVDGCWMAGMTLLDRTGATTAVATSRAAGRVDAIQYRVNGGPCLEAYRRQAVVRIESTEDDARWPEFCQGAVDEGVLSTLSFPLVVQGDGLGALNLYSNHRNGFDDRDERTGTTFALHASTTLANVRAYWQIDSLRHNLEQALETRGVIDQAKGILMAQEDISADDAFDVLKRASQRANRKIHDLAAEIVESRGRTAKPLPAD